MLVEITKTSAVVPVVGLKVNTPFKGQVVILFLQYSL